MIFFWFLSLTVCTHVLAFDKGFEQDFEHLDILSENLTLGELLDVKNEDLFNLLTAENIEDDIEIAGSCGQRIKQLLERLRIRITNKIADIVLKIVGRLIVRAGLDPLDLVDQTFEFPPRGSLALTNGSLLDISSIYRYRDINIKLKNKKLTVNFPISFRSLKFNYDYLTKVMLVSVKGSTLGGIQNLSLNVEISYDLKTRLTTLEEVDITNTGKISVKVEGNERYDWITNEMTQILNNVLHPVIIRVVEGIVTNTLENVIDLINSRVARETELIV